MTLLTSDEKSLRQRASKRAWYVRNKDQQIAAERARCATRGPRYRDPVRRRDANLKRLYGINGQEHWEAIFDAQGRKCACCETTDPHYAQGWNVDHDHNNPEPNHRAILCGPCNIAIGNAKECPSRLRACAGYLEAQKRQQQEKTYGEE
jgi:hypothetical protein